MKETRRARPICIPSAPDSFAIALIANDQLFERRIVQMKLTSRAQSLDCPDEHQIRCARAETWPRRQNEEFAGLEMCRRLKADFCEVRNRITAPLRHLLDLLENQSVAVSSQEPMRRECKDCKKNGGRQSLHGRISNHQNWIWQRLSAWFVLRHGFL